MTDAEQQQQDERAQLQQAIADAEARVQAAHRRGDFPERHDANAEAIRLKSRLHALNQADADATAIDRWQNRPETSLAGIDADRTDAAGA